jgi:hypothetical protein
VICSCWLDPSGCGEGPLVSSSERDIWALEFHTTWQILWAAWFWTKSSLHCVNWTTYTSVLCCILHKDMWGQFESALPCHPVFRISVNAEDCLTTMGNMHYILLHIFTNSILNFAFLYFKLTPWCRDLTENVIVAYMLKILPHLLCWNWKMVNLFTRTRIAYPRSNEYGLEHTIVFLCH